MGKFINIAGQKFGRITVLYREPENTRKLVQWMCKCDCGKNLIAHTNALRRGNTKSCGCLHKELLSQRSLIDLTGRKFGRLLVLSRGQNRGKEDRVTWRCLCDCGKRCDIRAKSLITGNTQSCGCLRKELVIEKFRANLVGQKFNRLTVINYVCTKKQQAIWLCICDCGNRTNVPTQALRSGNTKSCGCLGPETTSRICSDNLSGQKFNRLLICERIGSHNNRSLWKCLCDCGKYHNATSYSLKSGNVKSCGCLTRENSYFQKGNKHPQWNHNLTEEDRKQLHNERQWFDPLCHQWAKKVKERDKYVCQCCKTIGGKLESHHIHSWKNCSELRYDINNGITLCRLCHRKYHKIYRKIGINRMTLNSYIESYNNGEQTCIFSGRYGNHGA